MANLSFENGNSANRLFWFERLLKESKNKKIHLMFSKASLATIQIRKKIHIRYETKTSENNLYQLNYDDPNLHIYFGNSENNISLKLSPEKLEQKRLELIDQVEEGESKEKTDSQLYFPQVKFFSQIGSGYKEPYHWECVCLTEEEFQQNFPRIGPYFVPYVVKLCFGHFHEIDDADKVRFTKNLIAPALELTIKKPFEVEIFQPSLIGFVEIHIITTDLDFIERFSNQIQQLCKSKNILECCIHDASGIVRKTIPEAVLSDEVEPSDYFENIYEKGMQNTQKSLNKLYELLKSKPS